MSTTKTQRILSLLLALFFVGSTVGVVFYYVSENKQQAKQEEELAALQQQLNTQSQAENDLQEDLNVQDSTVLKGTQLANFQPIGKVDSLQITDLVEGTGETVSAGATVTVNYTGALASNGQIFESSLDSGQTATFGLDQVIQGWTDGIPGMKVGGTRRLIIPAAMAYGSSSPSADIPANSDLVFDVVLVSIN